MVNKVLLVGNLGKDPEIRTLDSGIKVATFSLATSESFKDRDGERQTKTTWHNIVLWKGLAEIAERYLNKGSQVCLEGKIQNRSWENNNGDTVHTTEIVCDNLTMLGKKNG
jgi:single-strand DNA-binding protein